MVRNKTHETKAMMSDKCSLISTNTDTQTVAQLHRK